MTIYSLDVLLSQFGTSLLFHVQFCCFLPAYRFLKGQVRWSSIPISWRIFQCVVIHTVKCFGIVNETEVDVFFWNSLAFSMIHRMLAIWTLVPLPFLNPAWTSGSSQFMYCWSLAWRILSITLLVCVCACVSCSVVPNSLRLRKLQPAKLLSPWDFPGKDAGVGCLFLP